MNRDVRIGTLWIADRKHHDVGLKGGFLYKFYVSIGTVEDFIAPKIVRVLAINDTDAVICARAIDNLDPILAVA
jgi:hypothetical protein